MEEEGGGGRRRRREADIRVGDNILLYTHTLPTTLLLVLVTRTLQLLTSHPTHATLYRESVRALVPLSRPRTFHSRARVLRINGSNLRLSRASSALSV